MTTQRYIQQRYTEQELEVLLKQNKARFFPTMEHQREYAFTDGNLYRRTEKGDYVLNVPGAKF